MRAPGFWSRPVGLAATLLAPAGAVFAAVTRARVQAMRPQDVGIPVVCVGNLVAGGTGKTPVAMAIGARLLAAGRSVHFLTRGYGGRVPGPCRVDPDRHHAGDVGDEPLLLARVAPTWVARDRRAGARSAVAAGAEVIVMDDGFQSPSLVYRLGLVVVDGAVGFGNRRVIPAGPLRETLGSGLARADAVVVVGDDRAGAAAIATAAGRLVVRAGLEPVAGGPVLAGRRVVAFAGIGRPGKLFESLAAAGAEVAATFSFPDHHRYREPELAEVLRRAESLGAAVVTTAKDAVRLTASVRARVTVFEVAIRWDAPETIDSLLEE